MNKETGGPAFPNVTIKTENGVDVWGESGMTLRDYFAAKAMQSLLTYEFSDLQNDAEVAYLMADAMLKARND